MTDDGFFDGDIARRYDADQGGTDPALVKQTVACLADLAEGGRILEFAVGTGRVALALKNTGHDIAGIELSRAMVAELRKKETGPPMEIVIGDMSNARVEGTFSLVILVFNTIENLRTQDAQVACFQNAARHLAQGGRFVIETRVPPVQTLPFGETRSAFACEPGHLGIDEIDIVTQSSTSHHVWIEGIETRRLSIPTRYVWPSELDLMGRLAGLEASHRWAGWDRQPFTRLSRSHVSVWRKPSA